jgi:hypothetical protein
MAAEEKKPEDEGSSTSKKPDSFFKGGSTDKKPPIPPKHGLDGADKPKKEEKADSEADEGKDTTPPADGGEEVKDIDADSIIDAFLDENPELVDTPVEDWPAEAIELLKETLNSENVDAPNGVLPASEDEKGEPEGGELETPPSEEPSALVQPEADLPPANDEGEPNPEQDFDIAELSKLVEAGDKDGAWGMLQNMFGVTPDLSAPAPTNQLDRMAPSGGGGSNALAKIIGGLKF